MKKILVMLMASLMVSAITFAQTKDSAQTKELTKEEKAALKAKSEADVMQAYKEAGLTDAQIASCKEVIDDSNKKSNELKKQTTLTDDEKVAAKKIITDEKNAKMKEIMGTAAYKKYSDVRKAQKANAATPQ
jgi:crotonobetainyl-CoA:carnitine CoA-transferase CaiB-like acyl-CoA transferase